LNLFPLMKNKKIGGIIADLLYHGRSFLKKLVQFPT